MTKEQLNDLLDYQLLRLHHSLAGQLRKRKSIVRTFRRGAILWTIMGLDAEPVAGRGPPCRNVGRASPDGGGALFDDPSDELTETELETGPAPPPSPPAPPPSPPESENENDERRRGVNGELLVAVVMVLRDAGKTGKRLTGEAVAAELESRGHHVSQRSVDRALEQLTKKLKVAGNDHDGRGYYLFG
jgi:hypothetical protein